MTEQGSRRRNPVLMLVILFVLPIGLVGFTVARILSPKQEIAEAPPAPGPPKDPNEPRKIIEQKLAEAKRRYAEVAKRVREDPDSEEARKQLEVEISETRAYIQGVQKDLEELLKPIRDGNGGAIPAEYSGYASKLMLLQQWLSDLNRLSGF